jgi:hypothetical protein
MKLFSFALAMSLWVSVAAVAQVLVPPEAPTSPSSLNEQDRIRDLDRQRAHDQTRARLGDPSRQQTPGRGFEAPSTDYAPDVPNAKPTIPGSPP